MSGISQEQLSDWIMSNYNNDSGIEEKAPSSIDMSDFVCEDFDASQITKVDLPGGLEKFGIILENVFTRSECQKIIEKTEAIGYGSLGKGKTGAAYRGNRRLQLDDSEGKLGEEIWRRIKTFIPETDSLPDEGDFKFKNINSRYRFAKYFPDEGFALHVDKPTVFSNDECSILTVNIYLNDLTPEQGGRTRFFEKMVGGKPIAFAGGKAGSIAIFKQAVAPFTPIHDGEKVNSGLKYLMRTDVIYQPA